MACETRQPVGRPGAGRIGQVTDAGIGHLAEVRPGPVRRYS